MIEPPEYAALIDPISCAAYSLRYVARQDVVQSMVVDSGERRWCVPLNIRIVDERVQIPDTDAMMFIAPFVKLATPVKASYAGELLVSRLTVILDGETIVNKEHVDRYLVIPPLQIVPTEGMGEPLVCVGLREEALLGTCRLHFLKNKSNIEILLEGVPSGVGRLQFIAGAILGRYTTRPQSGALFGVGRLDSHWQAVPETRSWNDFKSVSNGTVPSQHLTMDSIEAAFGDALKNLLNEKEMEIRRLKEDADLREKAQKKLNDLAIQRRNEEEDRHNIARQKLKDIQERIMKPTPTPMPASATKEKASPDNLDAALARARSRLVTWGLVALGIFVTIAIVLHSLSRLH